MNASQKRLRRIFTYSEKMKAVQRISNGETKAAVSRDINVPESTLRGWCKNEDKLRRLMSRLPSANTDEVHDGTIPAKRPRTETPLITQSAIPNKVKLTKLTKTIAQAFEPMELTTKRTHRTPPLHSQQQTPGPGARVSMSASSPFSAPYQQLFNESHHGLNLSGASTIMSPLSHPYGVSDLSATKSKSLYPVQSPTAAQYGMCESTVSSSTIKERVLQNYNKIYEPTTPVKINQESARIPKKKPPEKRLNSHLPEDVNPRDPGAGEETMETSTQKPNEGRIQTKVTNIWDKLLLRNSHFNVKEPNINRTANDESDAGTVEALENAEKFLAWLETSGDPLVTQIHIHQLRGLLNYLRSRRRAEDPKDSTNAARNQ